MKKEYLVNFLIIFFGFAVLFSCVSTGGTREQDLFNASANGDLETIEMLINDGVPINSKNAFGNTALHFACNYNQKETVEFLLEHGIDIDTINQEKVSPAGMAILHKNYEIVKYLVERGASLNPENGSSLLFLAVSNQDIEGVIFLINELSANPAKDDIIVILAALKKAWDIIPVLLENGANPNAREGKGRGPLRYSTEHIPTLKILVEAGSDINNIPNDGVPPISSAIMANHLDAADFLLEAGAELNISYKEGEKEDARTPLPPIIAIVVAEGNNIEFVQKLLDMGANPNYIAVDDEGSTITALSLAIVNNKEEIAITLLNNGADPNIETQFGKPIDLAKEKNMLNVVELIEQLLKE